MLFISPHGHAANSSRIDFVSFVTVRAFVSPTRIALPWPRDPIHGHAVLAGPRAHAYWQVFELLLQFSGGSFGLIRSLQISLGMHAWSVTSGSCWARTCSTVSGP